MTTGIINPNPKQQLAWQRYTWEQASAQDERLSSFFHGDPRLVTLKEHTTISDQALKMLSSLNDFDCKKVIEEIYGRTKRPHRQDAATHHAHPFKKFIKSKYPFKQYHFFIDYEIQNSTGIHVVEIFFDRKLFGKMENSSNERAGLYNVNRKNGMKYDRPMIRKDLDKLTESWKLGVATPYMNTEYAAVNGMLNDLKKAPWLMGVHLDNAYPDANPNQYTLYHNPTDNGFIDLAECLWDKSRTHPTHNAQHLSAVLKQAHQKAVSQGKSVKWVVHSQGAIIFCSAVEAYLRVHPENSLNTQIVSLHAPGANIERVMRACSKAGIKVERVNSNPFDAVPNVAGMNQLKEGGLKRSLRFGRSIISENGGNIAVSPHTLPYLGIETYYDQLVMAGEKNALKV